MQTLTNKTEKPDTYAAPLQYFMVKRVLCSDIWMENNANALQGKCELTCYSDDFILRSARIYSNMLNYKYQSMKCQYFKS